MNISLGHLISAPRSNSFRIALATAMEPAIVIMNIWSTGILGFSTTVIQIPPLGETHALPILPTPPLCSSAMITRPCILSTSPSEQSCLPTQMVDGVVSRYRICLPMNCVLSFLWTSYGSSLLLVRVRRYPSFCDEEISYPMVRSSLMCFQTAERVIFSSLLMVSPDIGAVALSR